MLLVTRKRSENFTDKHYSKSNGLNSMKVKARVVKSKCNKGCTKLIGSKM